jgi:hypothetical protein
MLLCIMNIDIKSIAIKSSICVEFFFIFKHLCLEIMTNHVSIFSYNQMKLMDS